MNLKPLFLLFTLIPFLGFSQFSDKKVYNIEKPKPKAMAPKKKEKTDLDTEVPSVTLSVE